MLFRITFLPWHIFNKCLKFFSANFFSAMFIKVVICASNFDVISNQIVANPQIDLRSSFFWHIHNQTPSFFDSAQKSMIDLIFDWKIRSGKIEDRNILSLSYMVNDFIDRSAQSDVFFNTSVLKIFIKFTVNHLW